MEILFVSLIVLLSTKVYMITVSKTIRVLNVSFSLGGFVSSPKLISVSANYFLSLVPHFNIANFCLVMKPSSCLYFFHFHSYEVC